MDTLGEARPYGLGFRSAASNFAKVSRRVSSVTVRAEP